MKTTGTRANRSRKRIDPENRRPPIRIPRRSGHRSPGRTPSWRETKALVLISRKNLSAEGLARELGVSLATANRTVAALRERGFRVMTVKDKGRWHYQVVSVLSEEDIQNDPLVKNAGCIPRFRSGAKRDEDEIIYGETRD